MTGTLKGALTGVAVFAAGFALLAVLLPPEVPDAAPERPSPRIAAPQDDPAAAQPGASGSPPAAPIPPLAVDGPAPAAVAVLPASDAVALVEVADPSPQRIAEPGNLPSAPGQTPPSAVDDTLRLGPPGVGNPPTVAEPVATLPDPGLAQPLVPSGADTEGAAGPTGAAAPSGPSSSVAPEPAENTVPDPVATAAEPAPIRRLPQVGVDPAPDRAEAPLALARPTQPAAPEPAPTRRLPQVGLDPAPSEAAGAPAEVPAWQRYRVAAAEAGERPPLGLVLFDPARARDTEAALVGFPVPLTVALDPFDPDAIRRAQVYRAAGHEVVLALDGIAPGATAGDLEVLLEVWARDFPEALGLIELPPGDGRRARALAPVIIPALAARGLALVAPDRGLSPMLAAGRAAGLPLAGLYRALDAADEDEATIRRQLDRAAFEAERLGRIAVFARADRAETRAAILSWLAGGGRVARVAPGAVGAVLAVP